ncbi:MAG: hypothetical protein H0W81_11960 [Chloroflexi bacterium]|nr:hypothetical protein [Chloroflexota bacterium]
MTTADRVIAAARADLGCSESPPGSNDGACVNRIQSSTGAYNAAWCASAVTYWWQKAGIDVSTLGTAGTADLVDRARREGRLRSKPVPGCAVVWSPGDRGHTEIVIRTIGSVGARTIGGNTGDAVREHDRYINGPNTFFIVPDELEAKPEYSTTYWWEDPAAEPVRHELRNSAARREQDITEWVGKGGQPGHVRRGTVSIRRHGKLVPVFTWWSGPRKRSPDWTSPPLATPAAAKRKRDANHDKVSAERPGHILRKRSARVRVN